MRSSLRLFARYLEPGAPTGLTGLLTHPSPRSTLISVYRTTLEKLEKFPESSLYRQSVEALTKHRLSFVEKIVPAGYQEWEAKARKVLAENPDKFTLESDQVPGRRRRPIYIGGKSYLIPETRRQVDIRTEEWEGERPISKLRGTTKEDMAARNAEEEAEQNTESVGLDDEPQLTADQIVELENSIGAGLIEEVIKVAEGELKLVDTMHQERIWEPLEEKPSEGQWTYFDRTI